MLTNRIGAALRACILALGVTIQRENEVRETLKDRPDFVIVTLENLHDPKVQALLNP
jgi:DNA-dependent RNA polymerase auxiliary subunit epsilon